MTKLLVFDQFSKLQFKLGLIPNSFSEKFSFLKKNWLQLLRFNFRLFSYLVFKLMLNIGWSRCSPLQVPWLHFWCGKRGEFVMSRQMGRICYVTKGRFVCIKGESSCSYCSWFGDTVDFYREYDTQVSNTSWEFANLSINHAPML